MILTEELFNNGKSINENWSDAQISCFGISRINNKGWKSQIIGKDFSPETIDKFLELRDKHIKLPAPEKREDLAKSLWAIFIYSWVSGGSNL